MCQLEKLANDNCDEVTTVIANGSWLMPHTF